MKKIFFILIALGLNTITHSQNVSVKIGSESIKWLDFGSVIGADDQSFYTSDYYEDESSAFNVRKYSSIDVNKVYTQKISLPEVNDKDCLAKKLVLVNGKLILFSYQYDKNSETTRLYANKFHEDGSLDSESKLIAEMKALSKKLKGFFSIYVSENKNSVIVQSELPATENDHVKLCWKILDSELNTLWDNTTELPYFGFLYSGTQYASVEKTDFKNGKVYFFATKLKDGTVKERDRMPSVNKLYCFDLKHSKLTETLLSVETRSVFDVHINFAKDQVILTSLYSTATNHYVFFDPSPSLRTESGAICEVYNEDLTSAIYKDSIKKADNGYLFYLNNVFVQKDGSILLVSEGRQYQGDHSGYTEYNSGPVSIHCFDPGNKTKWIKTIEKAQHNEVQRYLFSTISLSNGKGLVQFINDNRKNDLGSSNDIVFKNWEIEKNAQTKVVVIDKSGSVKEDTSIFEFSNAGNVLQCESMFRISPSEVIVPIMTPMGTKYSKITLE